MSSFKKLNVATFAKQNLKVSSDAHYWKNYEFPITIKEFTAIDFIDVCQAEPYYIAVTAGPKVDIYHQQTAHVWRSMTRFMRSAYGGKFRQDGRLLIAGSEEGQVKLFDFRQKQLLRSFKDHKGPVHRACFITGKPQAVSFSDDKSCILWDIAEEREVLSLQEHTDFIRAGTSSTSSEHIVITGSYDHSIKMWDTRTGSSVLTLLHGSPIENIICYPSGSVFASAGGTEVKIWDAVAGKLIASLSQHHKTVTSLCLASEGCRLLSGSLDKHVKVYDVNTYSVLHSMDYPASILSLGVANKDSTLAIGMSSGRSGLISFQQRKNPDLNKPSIKELAIRKQPVPDFTVEANDLVMQPIEKEKCSKYDQMLRKFEFTKALNAVMVPYIYRKTPHITISVLRELIRRDALHQSIAGQLDKNQTAIFKFVTANIRNPKFTQILTEVANVLIDVYGDHIGEDPRLFSHFMKLNQEIKAEMHLTKEHIGLMGTLEMFYASSAIRASPIHDRLDHLNSQSQSEKENTLAPIEDDNHKVVIDVF